MRALASPLMLALWVLCTGPAAAAATYTFPHYRQPAQVDRACTATLRDLQGLQHRLGRMQPGAEVLDTLDRLGQRMEDTANPLSLLAAVHPDAALRSAAEACERRLQTFITRFQQNPRVHRLLQRVEPADEVERKLVREQLDAFEDAGVALKPAQRREARRIARELSRLEQDFARRVREHKHKLSFTAAELEGVPPSVWQSAPRDAEGRYLLGLEAPTHDPVLQYAHSAATRERMWRAGYQMGGAENLVTLDRIARLRRAHAALLGKASFADVVLRRRMARDEASVNRFLGQVGEAVSARERADVEELRADKAALLQQPDAVLKRWDTAFHAERVRRSRFGVDQEQLRTHFPSEPSLDVMFRLAERLFGVQFERQTQPLWHAEARAYEVRENGRSLGTLFVDLYPREDKYNHAAVWALRNSATRTGRTPAAALVVNFNRQGLNLDELETLLHEFGHALHVLLSTTRYAIQGGTNVQLDFVEAPSQMLEDWAYDPQVVALFHDVCASCPPVPAGVLAQAFEAREFGKGIRFARQGLYAAYDLALYGRTHQDPMDLWKRMEGATPLGHVEGTRFPAGFGHVASGYSAGYYSYLWSLVLAEDLRTAFAGDRLSADTGRRYREQVLSQGGQLEPAVLMQRFLGRPWNHDAFFKALSRP